MLAPFAKQPGEPDNLGISVTPPDQMAAEFRRAAELGFAVSVHAIGDRANRVVLDIFEEMATSAPPPPIPHRIEHVQTLAPEDLPRLAALGLTASVQPLHAPDDRAVADRLLGARGRTTYAFRSLLAAGTRLAFGSDAPVADANPFLGIHAALYRRHVGETEPWYPEQAVSLEQALHAYTLAAAEAGGWAATLGSITPGKRGDLVVLDRDLFALAAAGDGHALAATQVAMTIFDGRIVYEAGAG
jgi:predicted amidohydrolase YtcJ